MKTITFTDAEIRILLNALIEEKHRLKQSHIEPSKREPVSESRLNRILEITDIIDKMRRTGKGLPILDNRNSIQRSR